ncbi:uncharacterized protein Z519_00120 [Cladophialophora bantiana CBS 173.52]|uniref:CRAL-TRIO domain-containing protein n=1 Tax=Cladophialophora bantiana (strain ATCC 10958 / CBS 173.52 / CDC B-1940 / NIH 8579) TaxID=1442370 RepID=A0A0D2INY5_CLAB1|nr:uncharacterized protein Z519_00120 [Cladophialophora bantiana CBS 173.52]KIW98459.1 hypothetical protein Z519_00120 [Cladophialophora bantiana CBS 173.52]
MSTLYRTLTGQSQKSHHSDHSVGTHAHPTLTRTTTADPLTGTLNHLNPTQEQRLHEFKERLQEAGWWSPDGVNGKPSHDDGTLLRYLRARKFDVQGAVGQFTETEQWLREQRVEELYDNFDVEAYEKARLMYPQWTGHRDKRGIPIYVYVIKGLDSKNVHKYQKESQAYKDSLPNHKGLTTPAKLLPLFALYQNLLNFVLPLVSTLERPNPEVPVTNSTNIVDISGVGLTQFWNLKAHMQDASILATAHYPETLDRIFIIGAPAFFPTVWGWIKRWFDPVTVSKIFILSKNDVKPTLAKFMETKDFPKRYGGDLNWDWGDLPHLDDETRTALERDGNQGWVRGPCLWLGGQRIPVGSENGKPRRPNLDIEKMKPVVYAADYTEFPVHPDQKLSSGGKAPMPNGTASPHHQAEEAAAAANGGATVANLIATQMDSEQESQPAPKKTPSTASLQSQPESTSYPLAHPPAQPQPGPLPTHTIAMTTAIEEKLARESISAIPPTANGHMNGHATGPGEGHPEVLVSSDTSKGLAIEAERLTLSETVKKDGESERPVMERFVTAAEV